MLPSSLILHLSLCNPCLAESARPYEQAHVAIEAIAVHDINQPTLTQRSGKELGYTHQPAVVNSFADAINKGSLWEVILLDLLRALGMPSSTLELLARFRLSP